MEGVLVGISNGIYSLQDPAFTDETVKKEDIPKLEDKQGTFFSSVLYIFALPAFCRFNEISGSRTILAGLRVIGKYSPLPVAEDSPLFVKDPPQVDGFALDDLFAVPDRGCKSGIFVSLLNAISYVHDVLLM